MEKKRTALPVIAGILLIVSAGFKLLALFALLGFALFAIAPPSFPVNASLLLAIITVPALVITAFALVGGLLALQRKRWRLALTASIVAILPFSVLGVAATILLALCRDEFDTA